jgi:nitrile hydratase
VHGGPTTDTLSTVLKVMERMARTHDMGGQPTDAPIDTAEHALADWEIVADAVAVALAAKGIRSVDELRRGIEDLAPEEYLALTYYERWIRSTEQILVEKGVLSHAEVDRKVAELDATWSVS